jgi:hypothetical protein
MASLEIRLIVASPLTAKKITTKIGAIFLKKGR